MTPVAFTFVLLFFVVAAAKLPFTLIPLELQHLALVFRRFLSGFYVAHFQCIDFVVPGHQLALKLHDLPLQSFSLLHRFPIGVSFCFEFPHQLLDKDFKFGLDLLIEWSFVGPLHP